MQVESLAYDLEGAKWSRSAMPALDSLRTLVLAFGAPEVLENPAPLAELAKAFPRSVVVGCSSAGEIHGTLVRDHSLSVTVSRFEKTDLMLAWLDVPKATDSFSVGQTLAKKLLVRSGLRGVFILSEGLNVNGSELVRGLNAVLDPQVVVTGGLSGDGTRFQKTWVAIGGKARSNLVAAIGFYGDHVILGHGSKGGWDRFGPERVVTRSDANVLYELDGKPALALYKEYLGDRAKDLPSSGLLFPLAMRKDSKDEKVLVRTLLSVDHEKQSMTFAGDVPKGSLVQLMRADFEKLIGGASLASAMATDAPPGDGGKDRLVVAISCVGRRLVLGDRTEEEVEAVQQALPAGFSPHITGFYSYGEISPYASGHCDLHNQTMTLTVIGESPVPLPKPGAKAKPAATAFTARPVPASPQASFSAEMSDLDMELTTDVRSFDSARAGFQVSDLSYDIDKRAWSAPFPPLDSPRTLVLAFGAPEIADNPAPLADLAKAFPRSVVVGCSSAGEIHGTTVRDRSVAVTVTSFEKTELKLVSIDISGAAESFSVGQALAKKLLQRTGLRGVLVLSEGLNVNGSELVRGLNAALDESIVVTGGLSGDGANFKKTWVAVGGKVKGNVVAAVGFYGDHVVIGHGSKGGWDRFGPERVVTRSDANVLYEIDGKPALALYKEYLGDRAKDLPASGLLFPLALRKNNKDDKVLVRTLLSVDHEKQSMTFAGDLPKGYLVQLMKADFEKLIGGASLACTTASDPGVRAKSKDQLVIAISCVGRRLVLGDRTEEEVEAVRDALPKDAAPHITGFYSYGEISPYATGHCDLHNQTMTLTVIGESKTALSRGATKPASAPSTNGSGLRAVAPARSDNTRTPPPSTTQAVVALPAPVESGDFQVADRSYDLDTKAWSGPLPALDSARTLVLAFGAPEVADNPAPLAELAKAYPRSVVVGCSSAGEIHGTTVRDRSVSATITRFEKTEIKLVSLDVAGAGDSYAVGQALAKRLLGKPSLRGVLVLSEGLNVNGSELVRGLNAVLDESIVVTGGLSGDGTSFKKTWVAIGGRPRNNTVAAVGFYGDHVILGHGSKGGWDRFGPERVVTRSEANVLYELDGKPALALYKEYLGDRAKDLPASGLLFPLAMRKDAKDEKVLVRTLLSVDHEKQSMTFAGDLPKGSLVQLMKADFEKLVGGASLASATAKDSMTGTKSKDQLVVAISCVGRRLVLGDRTEEEVEAVRDMIGTANAHITGFYSYGEISPYATGHCDLHNQTMTLTVIGESATPLAARPAARSAMESGTSPIVKPAPLTPPRTQPSPLAEVAAAPSAAPVSPPLRPDASTDAPPPASQTSVSMLAPQGASTPHPPPVSPVALPHAGHPAIAPPPLGVSSPHAPSAPRVRPPTLTRIPPAGQSAAAPVIARDQRGDVLVVTLTGRLTESFKGEPLGRELSGTVILDLAGVERITSFGVREWLTMLGATAGRAAIYLCRCPEAVVNQLTMIRNFAGPSQLVSFFAPYLCDSCGEPFERLFDCEDDLDVIRGKEPAQATCPQCAGKGHFDDDVKTYFAFALPHVGAVVPPAVRAVVDSLAPTEGLKDAVEKTVHGDVTRIQVHRAAKQIRWQRIFDGIEGQLDLDVGGANLDADGTTALKRSLRALGPEITSIRIERCPRGLLEAFAHGDLPKSARIRSLVLEGYCPSCAAHRPAVVAVSDPDARTECKRCGESLEVKNKAEALALATAQSHSPSIPAPMPAPVTPLPAAPPPPVITTTTPPPAAAPPASRLNAGLGIAAAVLAVALVYTQLRPAGSPLLPAGTATATATATAVSADPTASASGTSTAAAKSDGWMTPTDLPPAWVDRPFVLGESDITLVGHSAGAATPEVALQEARLDAVRVLVVEMQRQLAPGPAYDFLKQRVQSDEKRPGDPVATRFLAQMGSVASPERVESALRRRDQGIEAFVRYRLPVPAFRKAIADYKGTFKFQGMELGRYFPLLENAIHSQAEIVVLSVDKGSPADVLGVRPADLLHTVGGGPVLSVEAVKAQLGDEWAKTAAASNLTLELESAGAKRSVRFSKPAQNVY